MYSLSSCLHAKKKFFRTTNKKGLSSACGKLWHPLDIVKICFLSFLFFCSRHNLQFVSRHLCVIPVSILQNSLVCLVVTCVVLTGGDHPDDRTDRLQPTRRWHNRFIVRRYIQTKEYRLYLFTAAFLHPSPLQSFLPSAMFRRRMVIKQRRHLFCYLLPHDSETTKPAESLDVKPL